MVASSSSPSVMMLMMSGESDRASQLVTSHYEARLFPVLSPSSLSFFPGWESSQLMLPAACKNRTLDHHIRGLLRTKKKKKKEKIIVGKGTSPHWGLQIAGYECGGGLFGLSFSPSLHLLLQSVAAAAATFALLLAKMAFRHGTLCASTTFLGKKKRRSEKASSARSSSWNFEFKLGHS